MTRVARELGGAWRRAGGGLLAGLALLSFTACRAAPKPAEWGVITIGGATYRLPAEVYDDLEPPQGPQDSMLLDLPLLPKTGDPAADALEVLLIAPFTPNPQERAHRVRVAVETGASVAAMPDPKRRGHPLRPASERVEDAPSDLVQVAADPFDGAIKDVFVRLPLQATSEYISCDRLGGAIRLPLCQHEFAGPGMTIKATYRRDELRNSNWIRQAILNYLQRQKVSG